MEVNKVQKIFIQDTIPYFRLEFAKKTIFGKIVW